MQELQTITQKLDSLAALIQSLRLHQQKAMLNPQEAAAYMGISKSTLYKHTSYGNIAYFRKVDLDNWLEANRIPSNEELLNM
jgi:hypothetical protein